MLYFLDTCLHRYEGGGDGKNGKENYLQSA
jgi:hypothetical protein